jgi:CubicO group peptidase (beta-lactamase class C family)
MLNEFYAMGSRLGAAFGQGEGGPAGAGGLAHNPAAMAAFMQALYQYGNPSALAQQVTSAMGSNQ